MRRVCGWLRLFVILGLASLLSPAAVAGPANQSTLEKARDFLRTKHYVQAVALLEQTLAAGPAIPNADALELFGEALAKAGRHQQARVAMNDYLRFYPSGPGAARVKLRLGALPAETRPPAALLTASSPSDPGEIAWSTTGSLSSYFIRDDSYNTAKDISIAPNPNADLDAHRLHQNTFLTTFDELIFIKHPYARTKIKISGVDEHRMRPGEVDSNQYGLSQAYVETVFDALDLTVRVGRQSRNAGGVLGRFDGAYVGWKANEVIGLNAVVGSINNSRYDAPFRNSRIFAGASVDLHLFPNLDFSLFAIQQNARSVLDRRGLGGEFRYFTKNLSVLGMMDYDIHFNRLNAATLSTSYTFDGGSVFAASVDHRRVPYLASVNALQGQPFLTLYDMMKLRTQDDVRQFAIDRTPYFESAMASYTRPLNEKWAINFDATTTYVSGTLPSGGVDGSKPLGREFYLSGQLIGNDIFMSGDLYTGALRYAHLADSNVYFTDLDARFPLSEKLRISPRLRLGYREGRYAPLRETTILPSLLVDYFIKPHMAIEAEIATKRIDTTAGTIRASTHDFFFTLGLRTDFSSEGVARCAGKLTPCLASLFSNPGAAHDALAGGRDGPNAASQSPALTFEIGARYQFARHKTAYDYYADDTPIVKVSRLAYDNLFTHSGEAFFRADAREGLFGNMFLKGNFSGGAFQSGRLVDRDYPLGDSGSLTRSAAAGATSSATLDLGYNFYTDDTLRLGAFIGFQLARDSIDAKGCAQFGFGANCVSALPSSIRTVSERDYFKSFRTGATLDVALTSRLSWSSEVALLSTYQRATDMHYFSFGNDPAQGRGGGFEAETALKYALTDRVSVGAGVRWRRLNTHAIDMYGQMLKYDINRVGIFGQISYRLGWDDLINPK